MKPKKGISVLLIEGRARQVLPVSKALRELGFEVSTYNSSRFDYGYVSRYPHHKILSYSNPNYDEKGTLEAIVKVLKKNRYDLIIPMNDDIAILLSKHKTEIQQYSDVAVNDWEVFSISSDKQKTMDVCMANDIPCPKTLHGIVDFNLDIINKMQFPMVVKPRTGCGAIGFHISDDIKDLKSYYEYAVKKFGPCLIQEYIPQTDYQYKAEFYIDSKGEIKSAIVFTKLRWYPINGGSSTLNVTVDRPDIISSCSLLLKTIGWKGYADIDLIQDPRDGVAKIIEINPRITGSVKICFASGINFAQQIMEDFEGKNVTAMFDYQKNVFLRYFQKDLLWLFRSPDRFKTKPSWFNFRNNVDQIWDWKDPLPFIASSLTSLSKLKEDANKRK